MLVNERKIELFHELTHHTHQFCQKVKEAEKKVKKKEEEEEEEMMMMMSEGHRKVAGMRTLGF